MSGGQITAELNQVCRRLRQYENEGQWLAALRDGVALGAGRFAIFSLKYEMLQLRSEQSLELPAGAQIPIATAKAFAAAVEARDPLVTLRTRAEVGEILSSGEQAARAHLFPIVNARRVVAMAFVAEDDSLDVNAMELVTGVAGAALERESNRALHAQIAVAPAKQTVAAAVERKLPPWADLSKEARVLHSRAQRFARVAVAEMQVRRPEICRVGREKSNLYLLLRDEIDKARETYARQFMTVSSMTDYLHRELVKTAAENDERRLGVEYPGQLV